MVNLKNLLFVKKKSAEIIPKEKSNYSFGDPGRLSNELHLRAINMILIVTYYVLCN